MEKNLTMVNNLIFLSNKYFVNILDKTFFPYVLIGVFSIFCELLIRQILLQLFSEILYINLVSLFIGILIAFYLNYKINFKIPRLYFFYSFFFFFTISFSSYFIQNFLKDIFENINLEYNLSRFIYSGIIFIIIYYLHLKISFRFSTKVGLAIYLNKNEKVKEIYNLVELYPDFIHLDLIDKTFSGKDKSPDFENLKLIKKLWPTHKIHLHIMSTKPEKYIEKIIDFTDLIFVHYEVYLEKYKLFEEIIKIKNKKIGIALHVKNNYEELNYLPNNINEILILAINNPGISGQVFDNRTHGLINKLNVFPNRKKFNITIDGGINEKLISKLNCERVVSNSSILHSKNPKIQILNFQTFSKINK